MSTAIILQDWYYEIGLTHLQDRQGSRSYLSADRWDVNC